ncbi:MAG: hypothetical protein ACE5OZ_21910 [Candidatus Heimdallarchaeota archaeon]
MKTVNLKRNGFRIQKASVVLLPPIIAGWGLLAGLNLLTIAFGTLAVTLGASLYNRHLSATSENSLSPPLQDAATKPFKNNSHMIVYKSAKGPQILAFYKIISRPHDYSLHTLKASFANSKLAIYPMIHTNGPFLAIRFSDKGLQSQQKLILEAPDYLEKLIETMMLKLPGLTLTRASSTEVKALLTVFGVRKTHGVVPQADPTDQRQKASNHEPQGQLAEKLRLSVEQRELLLIPPEEQPLRAERVELEPLKVPLKTSKPLDNNRKAVGRHSANSSDETPSVATPGPVFTRSAQSDPKINSAIEDLRELYTKIQETTETVLTKTNSIPITSTGKRIAGRLVIKDIGALLAILKSFPDLSTKAQERISACSTYLDKQFRIPGSNANAVPSDDIWKQIPVAIEFLEGVVREILSKLGSR